MISLQFFSYCLHNNTIENALHPLTCHCSPIFVWGDPERNISDKGLLVPNWILSGCGKTWIFFPSAICRKFTWRPSSICLCCISEIDCMLTLHPGLIFLGSRRLFIPALMPLGDANSLFSHIFFFILHIITHRQMPFRAVYSIKPNSLVVNPCHPLAWLMAENTVLDYGWRLMKVFGYFYV